MELTKSEWEEIEELLQQTKLEKQLKDERKAEEQRARDRDLMFMITTISE